MHPDDVDVASLDCAEFTDWLLSQNFDVEECEIIYGT